MGFREEKTKSTCNSSISQQITEKKLWFIFSLMTPLSKQTSKIILIITTKYFTNLRPKRQFVPFPNVNAASCAEMSKPYIITTRMEAQESHMNTQNIYKPILNAHHRGTSTSDLHKKAVGSPKKDRYTRLHTHTHLYTQHHKIGLR